MKKTFLFCVAATFSLNSCSPLAPDVQEFADPEGEILREMNNNGIPSIAAYVVKGDDIVWERYYGYADVARRRVPDSSTSYALASVSKLVVVTAVMQLYEQGRIDLYADVNQYLPFRVRNPRYPDRSITPYQLLTHTSGLAWPLTESEVPWNCTLGDWYGHAGGMDGAASYVEFQRESNLGLMVVSNMHHKSLYPGGKIHALLRRISRRYQ